ncbi:MAG: flavodoxin-dependent (E)-4-hydroxy-3-methylbut-2-enyl-diphosphate synthase [Fidelibacterota bacterium]
MVQAYRLLVKTMNDETMNYPLHLGVTEAGDGEDGRIKSAVGIGTLLEDGLGDTIRVSLTEEPEAEIPVAKDLVGRYVNREKHSPIQPIENLRFDPFFRQRRETNSILNIGGENVPIVIGDLSNNDSIQPEDLTSFGYLYSESQDKWQISDQAIDLLCIGQNSIEFKIPGTLSILQSSDSFEKKERHYPLFDSKNVQNIRGKQISFFLINSIEKLVNLKNLKNIILILETNNDHGLADQRRFFIVCSALGIQNPIIVKRSYSTSSENELLLYSATDLGGLQLDGFGDGIWVDSDLNPSFVNETSFGILQASRSRISKTEYISCPSCGRTLFDLQETTAKIRARTHHLKGLKIGIMGCIVNGPGEMADADYGYVGTGISKISLYKGQEIVEKNISETDAVDALISLIMSHGDWVDPVDV